MEQKLRTHDEILTEVKAHVRPLWESRTALGTVVNVDEKNEEFRVLREDGVRQLYSFQRYRQWNASKEAPRCGDRVALLERRDPARAWCIFSITKTRS